jgi:hypothetical protein
MTKQLKLYLAAYCAVRYENSGLNLSDESIMNITNFVLKDSELDNVDRKTFFDEHFVSSYFEMNDIELAECIQKDLVIHNQK